MDRIKIINEQNCRMVYFDGKNLEEKEIMENTEKFTTLGIQNNINLFLLDVVGTRTTPKVRESSANSVKRTTAHFGKAYYALVGLSAVQRIIANVLTKDQFFAENVEDAKKWLVSRSLKGKMEM
jgi:hypothetical protein